MRVGSFLVAILVTMGSSADVLADQWDPFTSRGSGNGFAPMSTATTTSESTADEFAEPERRWYGAQTLAVDAISIGLVLGGARARATEWSTLGILGFVAGGPLVHAFHGHGEKALGSGLMRVGFPVAGGVIGYAAAADDQSWTSGLYGFVVGSLLGVGTAITLDASVLAWEPRRIERWRPNVSLGQDRALVGATGSF